jgi:hypothetical protein
MTHKPLSFVSLFAGIGGFDLGLDWRRDQELLQWKAGEGWCGKDDACSACGKAKRTRGRR